MKTVTTYLSFDGNCRQAMSFYQQCMKTEVEFNPYPDSDKIMHSQLVRSGAPILMASDTPQPLSLRPGNNFSVSIDCESLDEIERLFTSFSANGEVRMPLTDAPWDARFGMLTDQFGVQWLFNCFLPPSKQ